MTNQFDGIVGQDAAKRKLAFYLEGYKASRIVPHLMFVAPKGCGKTTLAIATAKRLTKKEDGSKPKTFLEINCSTLKNVRQFINQVVFPHIADKDVTVLFDEASELPRDVTMALLTILNPNKENKNSFAFDDTLIDFDFSRQSFLFATTEAQLIFHSLMDRLERIDLEEYSHSHLAEIVKKNLLHVTFKDGVLVKVASVLRGNARQAQKMSMNINTYLKNKSQTTFDDKDWAALSNSLGILPLGLNRIELQILNILATRKESSLTSLSAKTGLTRECIQKDFELYLQKLNLMEISKLGRILTTKGAEYLKANA